MTGEPLDWSDGTPRSPRFGDIYFSLADGLAESRAVFLAGCHLPEAWAGRTHFVVAELGFGTGLNILALIDLWRRTRPAGGRLHVFSIEAFPMARADAARALGAWPELADLSARVLASWPQGRPGLHRIAFDEEGVILDLAIAEAVPALAAWDGEADAWFLDGFAPARNPEMWSQAVLDLVAQRSAPGARAATFTVAGLVRRGLAQAGFTVEKRPGHGAKRERLEAWRSDPERPEARAPRVAVIGAGIAGAALSRAFRALGVEPTVLEGASPGAGASGNPAALVTPGLDTGFGATADLHAQAFPRAVALYREIPEAVIAQGVWRLERSPRDAERFDRLAAWNGLGEGGLQRRSAQQTAEALGEAPGPGALLIRDALVIEPSVILERWLGFSPTLPAKVVRIERAGGFWRLLGEGDALLAEAEILILAAGAESVRLVRLPLRTIRGQASWTGAPLGGPPAAWGGYAIPLRTGFLFGATHDRDDWSLELRDEDHRRNLTLLAKARPRLAAAISPEGLEGRAGLRAASPDHLPLAGQAAPGLMVLAGLGGRGFTLAPLLAEQVAALALGAPRPLPRVLGQAVDPARFGAEILPHPV